MRRLLAFIFIISAVGFLPATALAMHNVDVAGTFTMGDPLSIVVDKDGTIYTSQEDGTIKVADPSGAPIRVINGKKDNREMKYPYALALYNDRLYVTDVGLGKVFILTKDGNVIASYGSKGSGLKQFDYPMGLAVYGGLIYVADSYNKRVQVLSENGVFLQAIGGTSEKDPAYLVEPIDIAVDHNGRIFVVDTKGRALKMFDQNGKILSALSIPVKEPRAIALDLDGYYVIDKHNLSVVKYSYSNEGMFSFGTKGTGRAQFKEPTGICVGPKRKIYISDIDRHDVQVMQTDDPNPPATPQMAPPPSSVNWTDVIPLDKKQKITKIIWDGQDTFYAVDSKRESILAYKGGAMVHEYKVPDTEPISIAIDSKGSLWALVDDKPHLVKFRADGSVEFRVGGNGSENGYFDDATDLAISKDGSVYIADEGNERVQVFNLNGLFINIVGKGGTNALMKKPFAVAADSKGLLYVLDRERKAVLIFSAQGSLIREIVSPNPDSPLFKEPKSIAVSDDYIYVLEADKPGIFVYNKLGQFVRRFSAEGEEKGDLAEPSSIFAMDSLRLVVSEIDTNRIQVFQNKFTPAIPTGLTAKSGTRAINLYWEPNAESYIAKYRVFKASGENALFEFLRDTTTNSMTDEAVEPDIEYSYKISAVAREGSESLTGVSTSAIPTKYIVSPPLEAAVKPQEWAMELAWKKPPEEHLAYYLVYRVTPEGLKKIGKTDTPSFTDNGLEPNTEYSWMISAVSADNVESDKLQVKGKTLIATRPPIEIETVDLKNVFSNSYKMYENDIGKVRIVNNTRTNISKVKVSFFLKDFMDLPSEGEITDLPGPGSKEHTLRAVFNNKILEVTEDTPVQAELVVSYYVGSEVRTFTKNLTMNIYEKHKMSWEERERIAAFVTTKDPIVMEFTRGIVTQYDATGDPLLLASIVYDSLGALGVTYIQDPSNPYQVTSGKADYVDYLQYPRETLRLKAGDCDDLVILYSAALESLGITTKLVDVPGHIFMMFSIGKTDALGSDTNGLFALEDDQMWAPVEVTMVGQPFLSALESGSKKYREWDKRGLRETSLKEAWLMYKPANLPQSNWRPEPLKREAIDQKFNNEFKELRKISVKLRSRKYLAAISEDPTDPQAWNQLGIIYAETGETEEALKVFMKGLEVAPDNAALLNNLGNTYFALGQMESAAAAYEQASTKDSSDYMIWINLTRVYLRLNNLGKAKEAFNKAYQIEPNVSKEFIGMSLKLLGPI